jgi:RimJ/RimL family protein N-acetyltransferase
MKKIARYGRIVNIDALVYRIADVPDNSPGDLPFDVVKTGDSHKTCYSITANGKFVHRSFLFDKIHLLKLIGKRGPAIGDCVTDTAYRGQSIYPKMIYRIAREQLRNGQQEVFIIVNAGNTASVRGIEKAGFELYASIKAKRFLLFYFDKEIKRFI